LQRTAAGRIQADVLTVVRKYVDPGRGASAHVVFSSTRQPRVNLAVTRDYFNSVTLGETVPGYYFPDGYFIPQNRTGDPRVGRWFFLSLGVLLGLGHSVWLLRPQGRRALVCWREEWFYGSRSILQCSTSKGRKTRILPKIPCFLVKIRGFTPKNGLFVKTALTDGRQAMGEPTASHLPV
jgi:hypothetical protein